jgi:hypothetical protein
MGSFGIGGVKRKLFVTAGVRECVRFAAVARVRHQVPSAVSRNAETRRPNGTDLEVSMLPFRPQRNTKTMVVVTTVV